MAEVHRHEGGDALVLPGAGGRVRGGGLDELVGELDVAVGKMDSEAV